MDHDFSLEGHIDELGAPYSWLRETANLAERRDAVAIVDIALGEKLPLPGVLSAPGGLRALRRALERAQDRRGRKQLLTGMADWVSWVQPASLDAFLEGLPLLAPAVGDLGSEGMRQVAEAVNREPRFMPCIYSFADTTREIIRSIVRLATAAELGWMQRLVEMFPLSRVVEDREAERLLGILGDIPGALPLLLTIARWNVSSAYGVARRLSGKTLDPRYLRSFEQLVEAMGTRVIAFCLNRLPKLVECNRADEIVRAALATVENYGVLAGEALLEGRTVAARKLLG